MSPSRSDHSARRALHPADLLLHLIEHGASTEPSENMQWIADATMVLRTIGVDGLLGRLSEQARAHALVEHVQSSLDTVVRCIDEPVAAVLRDRLGEVRRRPMERAASPTRSPGLVRSAARELVHYGGGDTSTLSSVRAATSARFDLGLARHPTFVIAYAASGRSSTVAALGRRAFGSFVRTPAPPSAVEPGADLDFTDADVADHHAGPGWFRPTEQGLRAVGREMRVVLPLANATERALRLTVEAIAPAGRPSTVEVAVNERPVGRMTVADDAIGRASFVVPASLANRFDPLEISFRGPRGTGTRSATGDDRALLAADRGRLAFRGVAGAIVFAVVMIVVVPIGIMFGGAIWSALFGWMASEDAHLRADDDPST